MHDGPSAASPTAWALRRGDRLPLFEAPDRDGRFFSLYEHGAGSELLLCTAPVDPVLVLAALSAGIRVIALDDALDLSHPLLVLVPPADPYVELVGGAGATLLCRPDLRVLTSEPEAVRTGIVALGSRPRHDGELRTGGAPVLFVPDVLDPSVCTALIEHAEREGFEPSPAVGTAEGPDMAKRRLDHHLVDPVLAPLVIELVAERVLPDIARAFDHRPQHFESFKIVRYDAGSGWFRAHRDNTTPDAHHRRLALSIDLDAAAHAGGELRLPEFGRDRYRSATGEAVVFSGNLLHEITEVTAGRRHALITFLW